MRRLFLGIALAAGMLGLWGWDAGVVAAQKPPVATDTETAAKLDRLQWRLDELERKEQKVQDIRETDQRQFYEIRERDRKDTEKRLREFEDMLMQDVDRETQKAKAWVEYGNKKVEWWLTLLAIFVSIFGIAASITSGIFAKQAKDSEKIANNTLKALNKIQSHARNKYFKIQKNLENSKSLLDEILIANRDSKTSLKETKTATREAKQILEDIKNEKDEFSSLVVTQANPNDPSSPSSIRAAKIASEQDEDTYSKYAGEALLAQEKKDYSAALKAWEEAARIDPNAAQAYFGIGYVKQMLAVNAKNKEKIKLLNEAKKVYSKTISIDPESYASYNNLGNVISDIAILDMNLSAHERQSLLLNSIEKYEQALRIKPDYHEALYNWGIALRALSVPDLTPEPEERRKLIQDACEKYEQVLRIKPDLHEVLKNWGSALGNLAVPDLTPDPEERRELLQQACEKYEQALRIKPDYHEALENWGTALLSILSPELTANAEKRLELINLAESKCLEARRLNPKVGAYNLACIASLTNKPQECQKRLRESLSDEDFPGCAHLRTDTDLDPVRDEQWFKDFLAEVCPEE